MPDGFFTRLGKNAIVECNSRLQPGLQQGPPPQFPNSFLKSLTTFPFFPFIYVDSFAMFFPSGLLVLFLLSLQMLAVYQVRLIARYGFKAHPADAVLAQRLPLSALLEHLLPSRI